jgi:gliding motility-associated-like protein
MKNLILGWIFAVLIILITSQLRLFGQCGNGGTYVSELTMEPIFQTISVNTGDRYTFEAYVNVTYVFSFCQGGGSNALDTYIEICNENGTIVQTYNDDHCGLGSEITWTSQGTGMYSVVIYQHGCITGGSPAGVLAYQTVTSPSEQDCLGAIPLCFDTYSTTTSYSGTGNYPNEITTSGSCPDNCMSDGEKNDVWYTFTAQSSGTVSFLISPNNSSDDYDWAVYDLTSHNCVDIYDTPSIMVSCNWSADDGDTGPNGGSSYDCQGASGSAYNDVLNVNVGETYVVNISNYSSTQYGYSITFGGSAQILDQSIPYLEDIVYEPYCGSSNLTIQFSERVWCTSIQPEDFVLTGPQGNYEIIDVISDICTAGAAYGGDTYYDDVFTLELADYIMHDGDYTLSVNAGGVDDICSNTNEENSLTFSIDGISATGTILSNVTCAGDADGSATVSVSGGTPPYGYYWSNGETSETATGLSGGYCAVTVSDSYSTCQDTVVFYINEPPPISVNAGDDALLCAGGSVTIGGSPTASNGSPPFVYSWTPSTGLSDPASPNPTATPTTATTYIVMVEDTTGCSNSDTVLIDIDPPININISATDVLCNGGSSGTATATITGGTSPYSTIWSNGLGTNTSVSGLQAGINYSVTVTDDIGCQEVASVTVNEPEALSISFDINDAECGHDDGQITANISGGVAPYNYLWGNGMSSQTINSLAPGTYPLTVTDANGCTSADIAEVNHFGDNTVIITQLAEVLCYGENTGVLEASMPNGNGPFTYAWSGSVSTSSTANNLVAGDYSVTITDNYGCPGTASHTITQPPLLGVNVTTTDILCMGGHDGTAEAIVNGGVEPYSVYWSNGAYGYYQENLEQGSYTLTVTDNNGCTVSASCFIDAPTENVRVSVVAQPVACAGQATGSAVASAVGGTLPYEFVWFEGGSAIASGQTITTLGPGAYTVRVEDDHGCMDETNFAITQPEPLTVESAVQQASCMGYGDGQAAVSVFGGTFPYSYRWSNGDTTAVINELYTGNYYLTITDNNDCVEMLSVYVPENPVLCLSIPNAFTPNADGVNDTWVIEYIDNYPQAHVMVFNRWGQKVYDAHAEDEPWDGKFNGELLPAGAYTYIIDLHNEIKPFTGVVALIH